MKSVFGRAILGIFATAAFMFSMGGACDHTVLRGEIVPEKPTAKRGEIIKLTLVLPPELEGVYSVYWTSGPGGEILFNENKDQNGMRIHDRTYRGDRIAYFRSENIGRCEVIVYGFYRQTNPQMITKTDIVIGE